MKLLLTLDVSGNLLLSLIHVIGEGRDWCCCLSLPRVKKTGSPSLAVYIFSNIYIPPTPSTRFPLHPPTPHPIPAPCLSVPLRFLLSVVQHFCAREAQWRRLSRRTMLMLTGGPSGELDLRVTPPTSPRPGSHTPCRQVGREADM